MRPRNRTTWVRGAAVGSCAILALSFRLMAAEPMLVEVRANAQARSPLFDLRVGQEVMVELAGAASNSPVLLRTFVYNEQKVLVGAEDPESENDKFEWKTSAGGRFYVLLENPSDTPATVKITITGATKDAARTGDSAVRRVFFATNREQIGNKHSDHGFGPEPGKQLSYGYCDVSIPRDHRMGELEGPSILHLEFRKDPVKHVLVTSLTEQGEAEFFARISKSASASRSKQVLIFVHGFSNSFDDAVRRTAQISYDLAFDGPSIVFSWPSHSSVLPVNYRRDERNAELSVDSLQSLIENLARTSAPLTVHVIAHSMGTRLVANTLQRMLPPTSRERASIRNVALIAPDIDTEIFRKAAGNIAAASRHTTLYVSSKDLALKASELQSGYDRAGQVPIRLADLPGIVVIDASAAPTQLFGFNHEYYADNRTVLSDLFQVIRDQPPDQRFGLVARKTQAGVYWEMVRAAR